MNRQEAFCGKEPALQALKNGAGATEAKERSPSLGRKTGARIYIYVNATSEMVNGKGP